MRRKPKDGSRVTTPRRSDDPPPPSSPPPKRQCANCGKCPECGQPVDSRGYNPDEIPRIGMEEVPYL